MAERALFGLLQTQVTAERLSRLLRHVVMASALAFTVGAYGEYKQDQMMLDKLAAQKAIAAIKAAEEEVAMLAPPVEVPLVSSCPARRAI